LGSAGKFEFFNRIDQSRAIGFGCVRQHLVKPLAAEQVRDLLPLVTQLPGTRRG
jgi:hypothetical protein